MTLYEIDQAILACIDQETGEVDEAKLAELQMAKDEKIEGILLWKKDLDAEAAAIAQEIKNLTERKKAAENKAESLKTYVKFVLAGEKFKTPKVSVSYRKVSAVEINCEYELIEWAQKNDDSLLTYKDPTISKTAVKEAIEAGREIPGAHIETKQQIIIK